MRSDEDRGIGGSVAAPLRRAGWRALASLLPVLVLLSGCSALDTWQRQKIYRPTPGIAADFPGLRTGDQRYRVTVPQPKTCGDAPTATPQQLALWWLPQPDADAPTLLYLHGTFRNLSENLHKIDALRDAGYAVLAVDYRGWGESTPIVPCEASIVQDARLAWDALRRHQPDPSRRLIYGHSMGSAVAVELASQLPQHGDYAGLVLESGFTRFADVAQAAGWLPRLLASLSRERFDAVDRIGAVRVPILMLHGARDTTVPLALGRRLFDAARAPKRWWVIDDAAHSDLDLVAPQRYRTALRAFWQTLRSESE